MLLLGINVNTGSRHRGYPLRMWRRMVAYCDAMRRRAMRCSAVQRMATYGNVVQRMVTYGSVVQRNAVYGRVVRCMATYCIVVLAGCSGCAHRQPVGVLCSGMSEGQGFSKGMSQGAESMSQSQGIKYSRVICKMFYTEDDLDRAIDSQTKQ